jgi:hypothetical protein
LKFEKISNVNIKSYSQNNKQLFFIHKKSSLSLRKLQSDAIKKKIMRNFLNRSTLKILNDILLHENIPIRLRKLNRFLINTIDTKTIKTLLSKSIRQIFEIDNFGMNLNIIKEEANNIPIFQNMLSQTFEET